MEGLVEVEYRHMYVMIPADWEVREEHGENTPANMLRMVVEDAFGERAQILELGSKEYLGALEFAVGECEKKNEFLKVVDAKNLIVQRGDNGKELKLNRARFYLRVVRAPFEGISN